MDGKRNTRRYLLVLVAVVLFVSAAGVVALAQPDEGDVFTGCLNENSGALRNVAVGFEPAKSCNPQELQITWDRAGPAFEGRIAALEERVAELEEPFGTLGLFVDCAAGDTVGAALESARAHLGPVSITIAGVCEEDVSIDRDNVHIYGQSTGDGIQTSPEGQVEVFDASHRVTFDNVTLTGGSFALRVGYGATVFLNNSVLQGGTTHGVWVRGGTLVISNSLITGNEIGMLTEGGADVFASATDFTGNNHIGVAIGDGTLEADNSTFSNNATWGISIGELGTVYLINGSRVADNGDGGITVNSGSSLAVGGSVISGNGAGGGIAAAQASTVNLQDAEITSNMSDGIVLQDLAIGVGGDPETVITDNDGFGINCAGPAAIAPVQNQFNMADIQFSGNTDGDTNCP